MTEESKIKREICDYLALFPKRCLFTMTPRGGMGAYTSRYLQRGWPDITGLWDNVPLFIEVKTPKGRMRPEQVEFFDKLKSFKAHGIVARRLEDVSSVLK